MEYHVAKTGCDNAAGTKEAPLLTIQCAADIALPGDCIIVHEGTYREWVRPRCGGADDRRRIVYESAPGEKVIIKGSEKVTGWIPAPEIGACVWKLELPNSYFGEFNPFQTPVWGDWVVEPLERPAHLGDVYLNGRSLFEAFSLEDLAKPAMRIKSCYWTWDNRDELITDPESTLYQWKAVPENNSTIIYANFQETDPNGELTEISVRSCCFYPESTGINYITLRGFEICHAACQWAPPTADQPGMVGPHWAKGWIIENNYLHDAKCCAVSLGKEISTGHNIFTREHKKPGYHNQMESVFAALSGGWSKDKIGSHIVRSNVICNCGQAGIVGHMGCVFSEICGNEIHHISTKHEFCGHEMAGIKLHAAIDVQIHHNYFHDCSLGTWLDWEAQGTRVSSNIYCRNDRDFMIEVTHGPCLVDHNIFADSYTFVNVAQGTAFVQNLIGGYTLHHPELPRSTPYHQPHSTEVRGATLVYGFDDRCYQNIYVGGAEEGRAYGTISYTGAPASLEEYLNRCYAHGYGDLECFDCELQPAYIDNNVYLKGAPSYEKENSHLMAEAFDPNIRITDDGNEVILELDLPEGFDTLPTKIIDTAILGYPRLTEEFFENPDSSPITLDTDLLGNRTASGPVPGPIHELHAGHNRAVIYRR